MSRNRINYNVQDIFIGPCPASGYHFINYSGGLNNNYEDLPYITYEDFKHISPNPGIVNTLISKDKNENTFPRNHNLLKRLDRIQDISYEIRSNRTIINQLNSGKSYVDTVSINNPEVDISFSYILSSLRNEARMGFNVNYPRLDYPYTGDKYFYRTDNGEPLFLFSGFLNRDYIKPQIFPNTTRGEGIPIDPDCFEYRKHISPNKNIISNIIPYYLGKNPSYLSNLIDIAAGFYHAFVLNSDGRLVGIGDNTEGQITNTLNENDSNGQFTGFFSVTSIGQLTGLKKVSSNYLHNLAILSNDTIIGWGSNDEGQAVGTTSYNNENFLFTGNFNNTPISNITGASGISAGAYHSLALLKNKTITGWGDNSFTQALAGNNLTGIIGISAGGYHSLAIRDINNGSVTGWGDNEYFQSSKGNNLTGVKMVSAGHLHSFALFNNGTITGWGWNDDAQIAGIKNLNNNNGIFTGNWSNTPVGKLTGVKSIHAGWFHTLALLENNKITGWGFNNVGQLNQNISYNDTNGMFTGDWNSTIVGKFENIEKIATSSETSLAYSNPNLNIFGESLGQEIIYPTEYNCITNDPYWPFNTKDQRNIFIAISENENDQNENLNETFSDLDDQTFISRSANKRSKNTKTISFGNCYISSYSQRGQIGDFIRAGATYIGENMSFQLSGSGASTPYVDPKTNIPNSEIKFNIPSEINSKNPISALRPSDLKIEISESDTTNLLNLKDTAFTAYEFNINFEREKMEAIGFKLPIDRQVDTPFIINLKLDSIVQNNNDLNFLSFVNNDCNKKYNITISCANYCNYDSNFIWSGQNQSSIFEKRFQNVFNYEFFNCKFDNVSYSSTIGNQKTATFNFSTLTDKQNYDRSLQMSGILGIEKIEDFVLIESTDKVLSLTNNVIDNLNGIYYANQIFNSKNYYTKISGVYFDNQHIYFDSLTNTWIISDYFNDKILKSEVTNVDSPDLVNNWNLFTDHLFYKQISGLSAGLNYFYINFNDGTITGYGDNSDGQLINDITQNNSSGIFTGIWENTKPGKLNNVIKIETNYTHTLALLSNNTVTGWGTNDEGQVTSSTVNNNSNYLFTGNWSNTAVGRLTNVNNISVGAYHSLALLNNGTITGWGDNTDNQATGGRFLYNITGISAGGYHSLAIRDINNGSISGWGNDDYLQSSKGNILTGVKMVSAGHLHSFALLNDGKITGWGWNDDGQVAGTTNQNDSSGIFTGNWNNTVVGQLTGVKSIHAGWFHTIIVLNNETVTGWGLNHGNQISKSAGFQDVNGRLVGNWSSTQVGQFHDVKLFNTNYEDSMVYISGSLDNIKVKIWETNNLEYIYAPTEYQNLPNNLNIDKINVDGSYLYQEDEDLFVSNLSVLY